MSSSLSNPQMGGWSFLTQTTPVANNDVVYVHPSSKSTLSEKSLSMCTESLGSETGSDVDPTPQPEAQPEAESVLAREVEMEPAFLSRHDRGVVVKRGRGLALPLPPPINGVKVECVREGGRLVMRAVTVGPTHACLEAERANGRLRLRFTERCVFKCTEGSGKGEEGTYVNARASTTSRCYGEESSRNTRDVTFNLSSVVF